MKKAVPILLLLAIFAVAIYLWRKEGLVRPERALASLAPQSTLAFLELTNLPRTLERWKGTELAQIGQEPQVKAFLEKPLSRLPKENAVWDAWQKIKPRGGFVAVARVEKNVPIVTVGVEYSGDRKEAEKLLNEWRGKLKESQPNGKADLVKHGDVAIETYTTDKTTVATTMVKDWIFATNEVAELEKTLDRLDGKATEPTLEKGEFFTKILGHLPKQADVLFYLEPKELVGRLKGLVAASGKAVDEESFAKLEKIRAFGGATKIDGALIREAWYADQPELPVKADLQQHALAMTSPATLLYFTTYLQLPEHVGALGDPSQDPTGMTKLLAGMQEQLAAQGSSLDAVLKAVGPEAGLSADWPDGGGTPTGVVSLDVKDRATVQKALTALTTVPNEAPWAKQNVDGTDFYGMPATGMAGIRPTIALTDRFLVAGLSYEAVKKAVDDSAKTGGKLSDVAAFQSAKKEVPAANQGLGYIDTAKIFQNVYSQARPMLMLYASFSKDVSEYADASKLPEAPTIAKHLSPIVYSSSTTSDGGVLFESAGPVTATQSLFVVGVGAGAAAAPFIKSYLPLLNNAANPGVLSPTPTVPDPAPNISPAPSAPSPPPSAVPAESPEPMSSPAEGNSAAPSPTAP